MYFDANDLFCLHFDNDVADALGNHTPVNHGVTFDNSVKKFGYSGVFDGSDYVNVPDHADFDFGAGELTIDCWARWGTKPTGNEVIIGQYDSGTNQRAWLFMANSSGFQANFSDDGTSGGGHFVALTWTFTIVADIWYHLALVRSGNNAILFIDGTLQSSQAMAYTIHNSTADVTVGCFLNSGSPASYITARIDELRVSDTARWTENFTPETEAYDFSPPRSRPRYIYPVDKIPPAALVW